MSNKRLNTQSGHVTPADGNIFADLGFSPQEAEQLYRESLSIIEAKHSIRECKDLLLNELVDWIEGQQAKPYEVIEVLGISRRQLADVLDKKSDCFSLDVLANLLAKLGKPIHLSIC